MLEQVSFLLPLQMMHPNRSCERKKEIREDRVVIKERAYDWSIAFFVLAFPLGLVGLLGRRSNPWRVSWIGSGFAIGGVWEESSWSVCVVVYRLRAYPSRT